MTTDLCSDVAARPVSIMSPRKTTTSGRSRIAILQDFRRNVSTTKRETYVHRGGVSEQEEGRELSSLDVVRPEEPGRVVGDAPVKERHSREPAAAVS